MDLNPIVLSIPVFFLLIGIEYLWSWRKGTGTYRSGDVIANIGCGILEQLTGLFGKVFTVALYVWVYENYRFTTLPNTFWVIFLGFIGVDFLYYWAHRMSHEVNLFWIGHVVHHQSEDYNLSVALRQGALQKVFTSPFALPLALSGLDPYVFLTLSAFNTLYQFWIHTEHIGKLGWFEWVFNTPSHHRVHHGRNPEYIDKNHGGTLIIWDRLFGTFEPEGVRPTYGITVPTNTFDPVQAHLVPVVQLVKNVGSIRGLGNKFTFLFKPPGWWPDSRRPHSLPLSAPKYDPTVAPVIRHYVLVQFAAVIGLSSLVLFRFDSLYLPTVIAVVSFLLFSLGVLGRLVQGAEVRGWEILRLLLLPVATLPLFPGLVYLAAAWSTAGLFWLVLKTKNK